MHTNQIPAAVLAATLGACVAEPVLLNSERIANRFGSYGIKILSQRAATRRSNLYSDTGGVRTCRTYAVVQFLDPAAVQIAEAHTDVLGGESIGATLMAAGWQVNKQTLYIGSVPKVGPNQAVGRLMQLDKASELGLHAYQLAIQKADQWIRYATIVEVHHPDYLHVADLHSMYGGRIRTRIEPSDAESLQRLVLDPD